MSIVGRARRREQPIEVHYRQVRALIIDDEPDALRQGAQPKRSRS